MPLTRTRPKLSLFGSLAVVLAVLGVGAYLWEGRSSAVGTVTLTRPSDDQLERTARTRILFGHQSVGANIITGLETVYADAGGPAVRVVETREPVEGEGGFLAHTFVGANGDPLGKIADFTSLVDGRLGAETDVALLKLCYVDIDATTDVEAVFDAYASAMADLERRHPDIRFLYTTVPLTADRGWKGDLKALLGRDDQMGPADNVARERYNKLVRERFAATGRLFDVAAVEATFDSEPTAREHDGETYYVLSDALRSDRGHLNDLGSQAAAAELIRLVAATSPLA